MIKPLALVLSVAGVFAVVMTAIGSMSSLNFQVLNPAGIIAHQQRDLIVFASLLSLVIVIPVFSLLIGILWRYRADNQKATYRPEWDGSALLETAWWIIPSLLILILSVITWKSSHDLDPMKSIISDTPAMTIQVVALDWKWLFIYPDERIATVNYVAFPVNTPVKFEITSDAPMNSFWIPQLGGQIYAMSGMSTHLNLMASSIGGYRGSSANISGRGFAGMNFIAQAKSPDDYNQWVNSIRESGSVLTQDTYRFLASPSENNKPMFYGTVDYSLYDGVVAKYSALSASHENAMDLNDHGAMGL